MALDYLPIQASAVPCERMFSSSAETDTKKRNRINPTLMEALQMLKFSLKAGRLNFMKDWITPVVMMSDTNKSSDGADLLAELLSGAMEHSIDQVIHDFGADE